MLSISPCLDKQILAEYCKKCRKPYHAGLYLYRAENNNQIQATGLFEITEDFVQLLYYESIFPEDVFLFDGVFRAGMNYAAEQGIENAFIPAEFGNAHENFFMHFDYPLNTRFNITNFFAKYKKCGGI